MTEWGTERSFVSQQVGHDKDPSLLKGYKGQAMGSIDLTLQPFIGDGDICTFQFLKVKTYEKNTKYSFKLVQNQFEN